MSAFQRRREALKRENRIIRRLPHTLHVAAEALGVPIKRLPVATVPVRATDWETIAMLPIEETLIPSEGLRAESVIPCTCEICGRQRRAPDRVLTDRPALAAGQDPAFAVIFGAQA